MDFAIIGGMEKITTYIYSFEKLRKAGYVCVNKTDLLWRLVGDNFRAAKHNIDEPLFASFRHMA